MPVSPERMACHDASVPIPSGVRRPTPVTTTLRDNTILRVMRGGYFLEVLFSMYSTASLTVVIFSASSSGISSSNASSKAMTNSTMSSESAPRSSTNEAFVSTWLSSTPSCSTIICFTFCSTAAMLPPGSFANALILASFGKHSQVMEPKVPFCHNPPVGTFGILQPSNGPMETPILEARGLGKRYSAVAAVRDITFAIRRGEILGVLGPNGSGKSTTVKMITGLLDPSYGAVLFHGERIGADLTRFKQSLG